jgi:hypothetical protein
VDQPQRSGGLPSVITFGRVSRHRRPKICTLADVSRCSKSRSLNHLVGAAKQRRWDFEAKGPRRLEIDDQFEMGRLLDWEVGWPGTLQDFVNIHGSVAKKTKEAFGSRSGLRGQG